jgi:hypothetical protein
VLTGRDAVGAGRVRRDPRPVAAQQPGHVAAAAVGRDALPPLAVCRDALPPLVVMVPM